MGDGAACFFPHTAQLSVESLGGYPTLHDADRPHWPSPMTRNGRASSATQMASPNFPIGDGRRRCVTFSCSLRLGRLALQAETFRWMLVYLRIAAVQVQLL